MKPARQSVRPVSRGSRPSPATRILLADDHPILVQGVKGLLEREEFKVIGEAHDGRQAIRLADRLKPDVAVLDLAMPLLNGLDAAREITKVSPSTRTLLLTNYADEQYVLEALRAGVNGYILKTRTAFDLVKAIHEVAHGALYLSEGIPHDLLETYLRRGTQRSVSPLSGREREVLQLIAEGMAMKEIATILGVSVKTIETHRMRLKEKLRIQETAGLVRYAIRQGVIQP